MTTASPAARDVTKGQRVAQPRRHHRDLDGASTGRAHGVAHGRPGQPARRRNRETTTRHALPFARTRSSNPARHSTSTNSAPRSSARLSTPRRSSSLPSKEPPPIGGGTSPPPADADPRAPPRRRGRRRRRGVAPRGPPRRRGAARRSSSAMEAPVTVSQSKAWHQIKTPLQPKRLKGRCGSAQIPNAS